MSHRIRKLSELPGPFLVIVDECYGFEEHVFQTAKEAKEYADQCEDGNFKTIILDTRKVNL